MTIVNAASVQPSEREGVNTRALLNKNTPTDTLNIGLISLDPGGQQHPHAHEDEEGFFVVEGSGTVRLGDAEHPIFAGMAILAPAGTVHCFKNSGNAPLTLVFIHAIHTSKTSHL